MAAEPCATGQQIASAHESEDDDSDASGPGGLIEAPDGPRGRRGSGAPSVREKTLHALEEARFPAYPGAPEAPFALADNFADRDAPTSSRKWELAQSLARVTFEHMWQRRQLLQQAPVRQQHAQPQPHLAKTQRSSMNEERGGRTRKPTAIMRSNVEVARLMGMPGSKQRQLSADDIEHEREAPQHLTSSRNIKEKGPDDDGDGGGAAVAALSSAASAAPFITSPPSDVGSRRVQRVPSDTPDAAPPDAPNLSTVASVPAALAEMPCVLTDVVLQAVVPPRALLLSPSDNSSAGHSPGGSVAFKICDTNRQVVSGVLVRGGEAVLVRDAEDLQPSNKRKRRTPGWLEGHERDDDGEGEEEEADGYAKGSANRSGGEAPASSSFHGRRAQRRVVSSVAATVVAAGGSQLLQDAARGAHLAPCAVAVLGVLPPPMSPQRHPRSASMPPPLVDGERSRDRLAEGGRSARDSQERPRDRTHTSHRSHSGDKDALSADAFEISFGGLPSPRIIQVVRPKEIHLPQWRVLPAASIPVPLRDGAPPAAESSGRGKRGGGDKHSRPKHSTGKDADAKDLEGSADAVYERRHARTLERAITAARSVAAMLAQKERQKQHANGTASSHDKSAAAADKSGGGEPPGKMTEEEKARFEERFRPSELAALCAAQRMHLDDAANGGGGADDANGALGAASASAGFFGRMGGNRGGRDRDREAEGEVEDMETDGHGAESVEAGEQHVDEAQ